MAGWAACQAVPGLCHPMPDCHLVNHALDDGMTLTLSRKNAMPLASRVDASSFMPRSMKPKWRAPAPRKAGTWPVPIDRQGTSQDSCMWVQALLWLSPWIHADERHQLSCAGQYARPLLGGQHSCNSAATPRLIMLQLRAAWRWMTLVSPHHMACPANVS